MSVGTARVVALFVLFGVTMLAGFGPVFGFSLWKKRQETNLLDSQDEKRKQKSRSDKILHLLLVFGGGVLLATCFVHMIPEIQENYDHYMETRESTHSHDEHEHDDDHNELITNTSTSLMETNELSVNTSNSRDNIYKHPIHHDGEDEHSHGSVPWVEICICLGLFLTYFIEESVLLLIGRDSAHHHHHNHHNHIDHQHSSGGNGDHYGGKIGCDNIAIDLKSDDINVISSFHHQSNGHNGHHHEPTSSHVESVWTRFLRGLIIVVAFLAHSIFDGIAIGLQGTTTSVWTMFFAICLHKLVVVFAIGFELFEKTRSLILTSIHMTIFAAMSPLGIFLSIVIEQGLSEDGSLPLILLNAVATGGILYIVFLEILQADRCSEINGLIQLMALMSGFILMTLITVMVGHGHD